MSDPLARRILFSTFGSAGDLFPLVPAAQQLLGAGHDVRFATSRSLGLYLRAAGIPTVALGDGSELRVIGDASIFSTRFDGFSSWRATIDRYVAPSLEADVATLEAMCGSWRPEVIVASGFAAGARIVGARLGIPVVDCSIYPQHQQFGIRLRRIAPRSVALAERLAGGVADASQLLWGAGADLLLHDEALLGPGGEALPTVGFPYWDAVGAAAADLAEIDRWLEHPGPHVLVTLGSFVGMATRDVWRRVAAVLPGLGARALFVGARGGWAADEFGDEPTIRMVGFVPFSTIVGRFDLMIHHGGVGTTFAAVRSGTPAVVAPQAFDQSWNARMVEAAGCGADGSGARLEGAIQDALGDARLTERVRAVAARLRPEGAGTDAIVAAVASIEGRRP